MNNDDGFIPDDIGADDGFVPDDQGSFMDTVESSAKNIMATPGRVARNLTPENMAPFAPAAGAVMGSLGGPLGSAAGAGLGQIAKRMAGMAYGTEPLATGQFSPREAISPMIQTGLAGLPGTTQGQAAIRGIGRGLAKAGQTLSGVKQDILQQAARQGYSTYRAPTMEQAQSAFGKALGPEGEAALAQSADDPAVGQARSIATDVGNRMDAFSKGAGARPSAIEGLKARQATDRIISSTPVTDKLKRRALYGYRDKFDDLMSSQSGALKDASTLYRQAIVRDKILSPTRLTKSGEPSAFLGAGGRGIAGVASTLTGTSPMVWGAGATTVGQLGKMMVPEMRQAVIATYIDRITTKDSLR
jgi:hypothetical protein